MFSQARWKLTGWYVLIICLISLTFSAIIYKLVGIEIERLSFLSRTRWERRLELRGLGQDMFPPQTLIPPWSDPDLALDAKNRLLTILGFVNGGILLISGGLAFFLSGQTLKPIKEMMEDQNRFVADASHELKTPLTSLKSSFEVFLREPKPKMGEARQLVADSINDVNQLQKLSESLLTLASNRNSTKQINKTNLQEMMTKIIKKYSTAANNKDIKLVNQVKAGEVWGNDMELSILVGNIIDNAIKYSHKNGRVIVKSIENKREVVLSIKDEGIGIASKDLPHIFKRFYRADKARSHNQAGGYGLGLAMAHKIAQNNKIQIGVKSQIGKGSLFSVTFQKQ
ncbi:MAG: HAMP domain-containing sensor histidine kinase [Candidatus Shapirobacteria bacterium]